MEGRILRQEISLKEIWEWVGISMLLYFLYMWLPLFWLVLFLKGSLTYLFAETVVSLFLFVFISVLASITGYWFCISWLAFFYIALFIIFNFVGICTYKFFGGRIDNLLFIIDYLKSARDLVISGSSLVSVSEIAMFLAVPLFVEAVYVIILNRAMVMKIKLEKVWLGAVILGLLFFISISLLYCYYDIKPWLSKDIYINTYYTYVKSEHMLHRLGAEKKSGLLKKINLARNVIDKNGYWISDLYPLLKSEIRKSKFHGLLRGYNVIIVVMESITAEVTGLKKYYRGGVDVTPFIDSLLDNSLVASSFFANTDYTAGAEVAILCSAYDTLRYTIPQGSIMRNYPYTGMVCLPEILKRYGYMTLFFNGYKETFDKKNLFMPEHGFQDMITLEDFDNERKTAWGIEDRVLYKRVISDLAGLRRGPFMAMIVTTSNHVPFELPEGRDRLFCADDVLHRYLNTVHYSDESLGWFIREASKYNWFKKTIFIVTADNGVCLFKLNSEKAGLERTLIVHHIPFLIFCYNCGLKRKIDGYFSQIDIAPTILDLLGISVPNSFMGRSIFDRDNASEDVLLMSWPDRFFLISEGCLYHLNSNDIYDITDGRKQRCCRIREQLREKLVALKDTMNYLILSNRLYPKKYMKR